MNLEEEAGSEENAGANHDHANNGEQSYAK